MKGELKYRTLLCPMTALVLDNMCPYLRQPSWKLGQRTPDLSMSTEPGTPNAQ